MNTKLAVLALLPLMGFMLVPVAVASSTPTEPHTITVYAYVYCSSNSEGRQNSGASLNYLGTTLVVFCTPGNDHTAYGEWSVGVMYAFTATMFAGGHHYTITGKFGVNNCGSTIYQKQETHTAEGVIDLSACFIPEL